jgi:hypothetical protein
MKLLLVREVYTNETTTGRLMINLNGFWYYECVTLEDMVRDVKIYGRTAIPAGKYEVIINHSKRFNRDMPLLLNVPDFTGVRIHAGNTDRDTEGCILVGMSQGKDIIYDSRKAFDNLFSKMQKEKEITIEIVETK